MRYRLAQWIVRFVVWLTARVEVIGYEYLDIPEGYIAVSNHLGRLDVAFVYYFLKGKKVTVLVAEKYQQYAFFRWAVRAFDAVWVDRFNADITAIRESLKRIKDGHILVIAPEGTRSESGSLMKAHDGATYLASKSNTWIVPVAVTGTEDHLVKQNLLRLRRSKVVIRAGKPFKLPQLKRENREESLKESTDEIMCRIAALLPSSYRGFYANHPRLGEILADTNQLSTL